MKILTVVTDTGPKSGVVMAEGDIFIFSKAGEVLPEACDVPHTVREILGRGEVVLEDIRTMLNSAEAVRDDLADQGALISFSEADFAPPIPNPKLILSAGMNYWKHLEEMEGTPTPKHPVGFIKSRDTLLGSGKPIVVPPQCPNMIDWEGELCAVIGRTCHNVALDDAMDYVVGYTIINDVSARDWVTDVFTADDKFPAIHAWECNINGKQLPGFGPCGPVLITKDEISNPHALHMETRLNDEVMQTTKTDDMIFKIPDLVSYYSKWFRFQPGDIITTGSPPGVGFGRDPEIFMNSGDTIEVEVERIGILTNTLT